MMFSLNGSTFSGNRELTCYSCHRGARDPVATPTLMGETQSIPETASSKGLELPGNLPTASQLLENYITALGGSAAIEKITSRVEKGSTNDRGRTINVEVSTQAPERQAVIRYLPEGRSAATFDGHSGWISIPGRPAREMHGAEIEAKRMDADLQFPLHIQQMFPELRVEYPERIGGREAFVLLAIRQGQPPVKFYFDQQSSLLVRLVRYADSPLGLNPQQIDYADYREVDGVQVPFRLTFSQPGNSSAIQFEDVRQNVPVDPVEFSKPPTDGSPAS